MRMLKVLGFLFPNGKTEKHIKNILRPQYILKDLNIFNSFRYYDKCLVIKYCKKYLKNVMIQNA